MSIRKIVSLMIVDLKMWLRQPKLLLMSLIPLIVISLGVGFFMADVEVLPVGIVAESTDEASMRLKNEIMNMKSGSGAYWFETTDENAWERYDAGELLGLIVIPADLSGMLRRGETVQIQVQINNINDDVTKNFVQRLQHAANDFNNGITVDAQTYNVPRARFTAEVSPDLKLIKYLCASVLGLTILLSAGTALAFSIAREFEDQTMKELMMGSRFADIMAGKLLSATVQTLIVSAFILLEEWLVFGFMAADLLMQLPYLLAGVILSAGVAVIAAVKIKQVLPAGIIVMVVNIGGWWLSGGLAPAEAWTGFLHTLSTLWPGTYFFQAYINAALLGSVSGPLLARNSLIVLLVGFVMIVAADRFFAKEAKRI